LVEHLPDKDALIIDAKMVDGYLKQTSISVLLINLLEKKILFRVKCRENILI